jgi:hypothetical protein
MFNADEQTKMERLVCFLLATLTYMESLIKKQTNLLIAYADADHVDTTVKLGFEDPVLYDPDIEISEKNETNGDSSVQNETINDLNAEELKM